jgi:DNA primase
MWSVSPETKVAVHVDGRTLTLTNLAKVLYPQTGFTKAEVLDYYQRVAHVLLPHITSRGSTHTAVRACSGGTGPSNGESGRRSGASRSPSMRSVSTLNPVPT